MDTVHEIMIMIMIALFTGCWVRQETVPSAIYDKTGS